MINAESQTIRLIKTSEYSFGESRFSKNESWYNLYNERTEDSHLPIPTGTEASFWDTVGGLNAVHYANGGMSFSIRAVIYLPVNQYNLD